MNLRKILTRSRHVLLDFDGPVCAVFNSISSADATQALAARLQQAGVKIPDELRVSTDPFALLHYVAAHAPRHSSLAEQTLTQLEVTGVRSATPTPGLLDALSALRAAGHRIAIVSNNSAAAVTAFLHAHSLDTQVESIAARTEPDPDLLKPDPYLLRQAMTSLAATPKTCVLIGDSVTDVVAARRAGTASIAYANKPGKDTTLLNAQPDALIRHLHEITNALSSPEPAEQP